MIQKNQIKNSINNRTFYESFLGELPGTKGNGWIKKNISCPFHDEKTPSFGVNLTTGRYNCLGCRESGDVFEFIMKKNGLKFHDDCKFLGSFCGIIEDDYDLKSEIAERRRRADAMDRFRRFEDNERVALRDFLNPLCGLIERIKKEDPFADELQWLYPIRDKLEYHQDFLTFGDMDRRIDFFRESCLDSNKAI